MTTVISRDPTEHIGINLATIIKEQSVGLNLTPDLYLHWLLKIIRSCLTINMITEIIKWMLRCNEKRITWCLKWRRKWLLARRILTFECQTRSSIIFRGTWTTSIKRSNFRIWWQQSNSKCHHWICPITFNSLTDRDNISSFKIELVKFHLEPKQQMTAWIINAIYPCPFCRKKMSINTTSHLTWGDRMNRARPSSPEPCRTIWCHFNLKRTCMQSTRQLWSRHGRTNRIRTIPNEDLVISKYLICFSSLKMVLEIILSSIWINLMKTWPKTLIGCNLINSRIKWWGRCNPTILFLL